MAPFRPNTSSRRIWPQSQERERRRGGPTGGLRAPCFGKESVMSTGRTKKETLRVHIRWMIRRDMPEVLQTEQESFEYSWTEEDFLRCLRQRNCIGIVAGHYAREIRFMIYGLQKIKLHVVNFAVLPEVHWLRVVRRVV